MWVNVGSTPRLNGASSRVFNGLVLSPSPATARHPASHLAPAIEFTLSFSGDDSLPSSEERPLAAPGASRRLWERLSPSAAPPRAVPS